MACTMDRSTEKEGEEKMRVGVSLDPDIRLAIEQLWNWVGEQKHKCALAGNPWTEDELSMKVLGKLSAYSNVRLYMRKFFAGLIDFEKQGENSEHRL